MIIGIDISSIPYGTGVSIYTLNLVRHLAKLDKGNTYKLLFYSLRQPLPPEIKLLSNQKNIKIYHYRIPPSFFDIVWNQLHIFPIELFIGKCDVFHTWDWNQPPTVKAKAITTVHDFVPILFPQTQHPRTIKNFHLKMNLVAKNCSKIICVSQNTQKDLEKLFPHINARKIVVIPEAASDKYEKFNKLSNEQKETKIKYIAKIYDLKKYFLVQGTREPRKNLNRIIDAFTQFKKANPQSKFELAITGKYGWGQDIKPTQNSYIKILGYIPEKDVVAIHAGAVCLLYPSLYEGFGLPILQAFKVGIPVITSNTSSIPEVAGNAAIMVNPLSTEEIKTAITKIANSPALRQRLVVKGYLQAKKFSWDKTAKETLKVYASL